MMKKILFLIFILPLFTFSQGRLFTINTSSEIIATKDSSKTIGLIIDDDLTSYLFSNKPQKYDIIFPFFEDELLLTLERFSVVKEGVNVRSKTSTGDNILSILPDILSYKLIFKDNAIGVLNWVDNAFSASFNIDNKQYEITLFQGEYLLFESSNSINPSNFKCNVVDSSSGTNLKKSLSQNQNNVCIEFAVEIDNYTRQTFNSDQQAINWATAIFAGVSQLYEAQTPASLVIVEFVVWNTADPYQSLNSTDQVLTEVQDYWNSNNASIDRDLVHFMSKRNLGGGIAYLDALCSNYWGYAVSAGLNNTTSFNFPDPEYTWNLGCLAHEIGHNIGSEHTHNCSWDADASLSFSGGAIDNCVDVEGNCPNNVQSQIGTIMSYCHLSWTGGIVLEFHEVVLSQALLPGIQSAQCLSACLPSTWDCVDGGCVERTDGGGEYNSVDDCQNQCICTTNEVALDFLPDCYGIETSWTLSNESGEVLFSVSSYPGGDNAQSMEPNPSWDEHLWCLPNGCYTFTVADSYGDGMYGSNPEFACEEDGDYIIYSSDGTELASLINVNFGDSESNDFCVENIVPMSWNCVNNSCIDPGDGSGSYSSLSACQDDCHSSSLTELNKSNKKIKKITNLLGQESLIRKNTPMFYIYDDGSVEKKIIIE